MTPTIIFVISEAVHLKFCKQVNYVVFLPLDPNLLCKAALLGLRDLSKAFWNILYFAMGKAWHLVFDM